MPLFKGIVSFQQGDQGWNEIWWLDQADRDEAVARLRSYVTQRRKSLTYYARVKSVRASLPDPNREAAVFYYQGDTGRGQYAPPINDDIGAEPHTAAVNVRFFNADGKWRNLLMRGLPQEAIESFGGQTVSQQFTNAVNNIREVILNTGFRIYTTGYGVEQTVTAVRVSLGILISFSTFAPIADVVPGSVVQLRRIRGLSNANGLFKIASILPLNEYVVFSRRKSTFGTLEAGIGGARRQIPGPTAITSLQVVGVTSRNTGRPIGMPRGRASVRRS